MRTDKFETRLLVNSNFEDHDIELRRQRRGSISSILKNKNHSKTYEHLLYSVVN